MDIIGSSTKVEAGKDIIETKENHEYKQSGLTLALSSSVTDAVMDARQSVRRADEVKSDKLKALYAMKAADDAYRAVEATGELSKTLDSLMDGTIKNNGGGENPSVKLSVSYGSQKTVERKSGKEITHSKSNISTGELNVKARDGKAIFEGVDAEAKTIRLAGKQGVEIKGVKDESHQRTENNSSGGSVGVFVGASNGSYGFGVKGSVNAAKGKSNSDNEHWQNSVFNADKIITDSEEGGLTLDAANVKAKRWEGDIQHLTLTSRQDTEKYSSKQTSAKASGSVAYGSGGSASVSASYNKAKVDYAQVNQQSGIDVGEGGMSVTVHNHTQLNGAFIDSKADAENNRFKTKSIDYSNIENHSEIKTESASVSAGSGGMNPMQAISSALSLLGNGNESATSQTKAAIGQNIQVETETPENLQGLSRDVANANQQVQEQSLEKMQERQEMAKVIGELADSGLRRVTEEPLKEANAKRQQAEAIAKENPAQAEALKAEAKAIEAEYGLGSDLQMGVRAATAALQGLATNDINQAIVGAASPYLNQELKKRTTNADGTVNTQANLIAHALLGAAEAKVTGNNALAGATAAVTAEAAALYIMQSLYQTDNPAELNEMQKRNVANLSQIAAGLSGGLVGDSTQDTVAGAEIGKRAVENNALETAWDAANVVLGSISLKNNLEEGNYWLAALDAGGLIYDGIAIAIPFLPAGASAGIEAYRVGNTVKQSVSIGNDVATAAKMADKAAKNSANIVSNPAVTGTKIHRATGDLLNEASGKAHKLSNSASSYFKGANKSTGKQPDMSWNGTNIWADLTTTKQWGNHVKKYESQFGKGIPILYTPHKGVVQTPKLHSGAGVVIEGTNSVIEYGRDN